MTRDLSIIIPTLNENDRILGCLFELAKFWPREIIVVDNGSTDETAATVDRWIKYDMLACDLRLIRLPEPGKGGAVRTGMLAARGAICYMADCDLSTPADFVLDFLLFMRTFKADVVIGSRRLPKSRVTQSTRRAISGHIFHALTSRLIPEIKDTQCGFKMFTRQAAQAIFSNVQLDGLAFDVEVLLEARRLGYKVIEIPVPWVEAPKSRVHMMRDGIRMARDLWALARRYHNKSAVELGTSLPL
jgi:dolichyl-phosphate beta-glucosyltransferase